MTRPIITLPLGAPGAQGPAGHDGNTILYGTINPTTEGMNGDFYINTSTNTLFGPKLANVWPAGVALIGPQGPQGIQGDPGVDGNTVLYGTVNPTTEGVDGDFYINTSTFYLFGPKAAGVWPAGTSLVGPSGSAADHELLTNLMGGSVSGHYHSDQPINVLDSVQFMAATFGCSTKNTPAAVEVNECDGVGSGNIATVGSSRTVTTTGNAFTLAGIDSGSSITANGITVTVDDVIDGNTLDVFPAIDLTGGFPWAYKNTTRIALNRDADDKTSAGFAFYNNGELAWESYVWTQEDSKYLYPAWNQRAYTDNMIIHENGKIAIGGKPYQLTGYKEPDSSFEIYCHPFDTVLHYDGSVYTDNTAEAKTSTGSAFDLLLGTSNYSYFGKYTHFNEIYLDLAGIASSATLALEYWNGSAWTPITIDTDTTSSLSKTGKLGYAIPSNWAMVAVDIYDIMYYIRLKASTLSGSVTANCALPMGGGRIAAYRAPLDTTPVFSVDPEGRTAVGKAAANAQLDVIDSVRLSSSDTGYFHLTTPVVGPSIAMTTPTTAPVTGKLLGASSSSQLAWFDNSLITYYGNGQDGDLTISSGTTTLARDMFYNNVTISGTAQIVTSGYKIHIKGNLDLSNAPANAIHINGAAGGDSNGSGTGGAGAVRSAQTLGGSSVATVGAAGGAGAGAQAAAGPAAASPGEGGVAGGGGAGGNNVSVPNAGGAARAGSSITNPVNIPYLKTDFLRGVSLLQGGTSAPGGSSGGGDGTNSGRGGGGGASAGAFCAVYAYNIITSASTAAGALACKGAKGGAGGPSATGNVGGGGGGGGSGGGCFYLVFNGKTGPAITGLIDVSGGAGGNGSNGAGTGIGGNGGTGGGGGRIVTINTATGEIYHNITGSGSAGAAGSGVTGGQGGAGGVHTYTL